MDYDVIVVGAGHNALITAAYAAKAGYKVGVFERRAVPKRDRRLLFAARVLSSGEAQYRNCRVVKTKPLVLAAEIRRIAVCTCVPVSGKRTASGTHIGLWWNPTERFAVRGSAWSAISAKWTPKGVSAFV